MVPRAETVDVILIASSDKKEVLEEILLSIYQEAKEKHDEEEFLRRFVDTFDIVKVPFV